MKRKSVANNLLFVVFVISLLLFVIWGGSRFVNSTIFNNNVLKPLVEVATTDDFNKSKNLLDGVVSYLEDQGKTEGIVSIVFRNPTNDMGIFYQNLKRSQAIMSTVSKDSSKDEIRNVMDIVKVHLGFGYYLLFFPRVNCPMGMDIYPYNLAYAIWVFLSVVCLFCSAYFLDDPTD